MARDLHDLIGHTVNVMVVHAGAGRGAVRDDPDTAEQAFRTIEQTGRSALDELDRLLGVLRRDDAAPTAPAPGLADLVDLVDGFSKPPLEATLEVSGPTENVPAGVGLTVFRVTQEALTNVLKHADATAAEVSITVDDREVALTIDDNGTANGAAGRRPGNGTGTRGGRGLAGITERVKLHGGSTDLGPRPSGGFRVDCRIPLRVVV
jgi:signal transduction histidine kinase